MTTITVECDCGEVHEVESGDATNERLVCDCGSAYTLSFTKLQKSNDVSEVGLTGDGGVDGEELTDEWFQ